MDNNKWIIIIVIIQSKIKEVIFLEGVVYSITNINNGKKYIGSTVDYKKRVRAHINGLKGSYHENRLLQEDFDTYGENSFKFEILHETSSEDDRYKMEESTIHRLRTFEPDIGYNLSTDGRGKYLISDETRERMRQNSLGENNPFYGKNHTPEVLKIMSEKASERTGDKNPFYGKEHTEESKQKIRDTVKEKVDNGWESPQKGVPKTAEAIYNNTMAQSKRIEVHAEGKDYVSLAACSKDLGIHIATVKRRASSNDYPNYYYLNK